MLPPRVIVVSPYDFGERCAMSCSLVSLLSGLPLRVALSSDQAMLNPLPEVHYRYDRKAWQEAIDPLDTKLWRDARYCIWLDLEAFKKFKDFGRGEQIKPLERKHWLVGSAQELAGWMVEPDLNPDLTGVRLTWLPDAHQHAEWSPRPSREVHLAWDSDLPLKSRRQNGRSLALLVLAGVCEQDSGWALRCSRAGAQVARWMELYPEMRVKVICATPMPRVGLGDITPSWWARLRDRHEDRVELDVRPLPYLRRTRLLEEHDLVWNLSPQSPQLWSLEAAASGCGVLLNQTPETEKLAEVLRPCCGLLPPLSWMDGDGREPQSQDQQSDLVFDKLVSDWRRLPRPWQRPALELNRRIFQDFWRAQLGLRGAET